MSVSLHSVSPTPDNIPDSGSQAPLQGVKVEVEGRTYAVRFGKQEKRSGNLTHDEIAQIRRIITQASGRVFHTATYDKGSISYYNSAEAFDRRRPTRIVTIADRSVGRRSAERTEACARTAARRQPAKRKKENEKEVFKELYRNLEDRPDAQARFAENYARYASRSVLQKHRLTRKGERIDEKKVASKLSRVRWGVGIAAAAVVAKALGAAALGIGLLSNPFGWGICLIGLATMALTFAARGAIKAYKEGATVKQIGKHAAIGAALGAAQGAAATVAFAKGVVVGVAAVGTFVLAYLVTVCKRVTFASPPNRGLRLRSWEEFFQNPARAQRR